jgi:hypothetical protein
MTRITSKKLAGGAVLTGCVLFAGTPAYGAVAPEPEPPGVAGQPTQSVIDHYLADTSGTTSVGHQGRTFPTPAAQSKAMVEHAERVAAADSSSVPGVLSAQTKAQVEHLERSSSSGSTSVAGAISAQAQAQAAYLDQLAAQQEAAASTVAASGSTSDDDDVSTPLVVLALLGGGLITGAVTTYTLRRIRHDGPVSAATA